MLLNINFLKENWHYPHAGWENFCAKIFSKLPLGQCMGPESSCQETSRIHFLCTDFVNRGGGGEATMKAQWKKKRKTAILTTYCTSGTLWVGSLCTHCTGGALRCPVGWVRQPHPHHLLRDSGAGGGHTRHLPPGDIQHTASRHHWGDAYLDNHADILHDVTGWGWELWNSNWGLLCTHNTDTASKICAAVQL